MPTGSLYFRGTGGIGITVDTYSGSYVVSPSQGYNGKVLDTFPLTPVPNFQARVAANSGSYEALSCQNTVLADIGTEILSSASLLVTPNGYTEGVLFSTLPNSSSGDFTVTRATTATRTNASGLIELVPYNLLQYSEAITTSPWSNQGTPIVTINDTTAPNGALTADKITNSNSSNYVRQSVNLVVGQIYAASVYIKNIDATQSILFIRSTASNLNLVITWSGNDISSTNVGTFESVGDGWYRVQASFTALEASALFRLYNFNTSESSYIWGAQLVEGTNALPYQPTTTRLNISRADYSLGGCPNILLEPQRTNLALWSEQFDNAAWSKAGITLTVNNAIAPNGIQSADLMVPTTTDSYLRQMTLSFASGTTYTTSIYLKSNTGSSFSLNMRLRENNGLQDLIQSKTITTEWQRFDLTITATVTGTYTLWIGGNASWVIGENLLIWGAQVEAGAYATSYIPTTSASVTRNLDQISRNNVFTNGLITSSGGTWFVDLRNNIARNRDVSSRLGIGDNITMSVNSFSFIPVASLGRLSINKYIGGVLTTLYITTANTSKIAIKWNGTTADVFENGVKVISATAFTSTALEYIANTTNGVPVNINSMGLFPVPLSDSQCIELTGGGYDTPELAYASLGLTSESPLYLNQSVNSLIF
jgi:hypothetical protein